MIRAFLFDFDLTLADSSAGALDCIQYALARLGLPPAPEHRILESIGLSMPATLAYVAGLTDPPTVQAFTSAFIERADQVMAQRTVLYAEVPPVVRALQAAGMTQGIVSSKFRYRIEGILAREDLAESFRVIVGAEDTSQNKPHPGGLVLAVSRLGCPAEEVVYVGDHPVDAESGATGGGVLRGRADRAITPSELCRISGDRGPPESCRFACPAGR